MSRPASAVDHMLSQLLHVVTIVRVLVTDQVDQTRPAAAQSDHAIAFVQRAQRHRANRRVQTRHIAAAREDANRTFDRRRHTVRSFAGANGQPIDRPGVPAHVVITQRSPLTAWQHAQGKPANTDHNMSCEPLPRRDCAASSASTRATTSSTATGRPIGWLMCQARNQPIAPVSRCRCSSWSSTDVASPVFPLAATGYTR